MKRKKILFICPYPENLAPSQRLKFEQYYPSFREAGYEIATSSFIDEAFWKIIYNPGNFWKKAIHTLTGYARRISDLFNIRQYDVVYIHLWVTPFGPPFFEWLFRKIAKKVVYDIDDLVYLGNVKSKAHPLVTLVKGRAKPIFLMKNADHVITCTPYLDDFVRKYNSSTTDISSTINTNLYKPKTSYSIKDKFVIGWSGSHSTAKYLHLLDDVFIDLAKEYQFKLMVMGDADFVIPGVEVEAIPWREEYEIEVISRFDIGVYPLPNEEWVLGKSGLKALQYMSLGVPTIATGIGAIHRIVQDGQNGYLVNTKEEWKSRIISLFKNEQLRRDIGFKAVNTVEAAYSIQSNRQTYLNIINQLAT
ncbi:MAG: glycosyltransferase family 1 protein [Sphingobacteriales bacterium]|nr:MAG: glycosyltransferase family 1 protein [Sphingobacteriales bacterium]